MSKGKKPFFDYVGRLHELHTTLTFALTRAYEVKGKLEATAQDTGEFQRDIRIMELTLSHSMHTESRRLLQELEDFKTKLNNIDFEI